MACSHIWCIGSILLVFSCLFIDLASAQLQTVTLTSSVEQDGRQVSCPGEVVTFTCMVTDGPSLRWIAEPFINGSDPITFVPGSDVGVPVDMAVDNSGQFRAVLTILSVAQSGLMGDFTSELTVTASETLGGTVIQCVATATILMSITLTLAAPPSPPQQPSYSVSQYQLNAFIVAVQWESPASDGGVDIDNYTFTGADMTTLTLFSNGPLMATLTLSYNEMHMVSITASNCAGESTASVVTIHEVGCGPPPSPPRGSLGNLTSSQEGAEVTFQCNPGLVPSQQMMSVCAANGSWTPDPAELVCRADCGDPSLPVNGFVMAYDSTLEGSQIDFQCNLNFVPSQQMMSVCATNGSWTPNPAGLVCRADCGIPVIVDGSVNYTTTIEGSNATYRCGTGLIPEGVITAMCMGSGEWAPNPAEAGCRLLDQATCGAPPSPSNGFVDFTNVIEGSEATFRCDSGPEMTAVCTASGEWVPNPGDLNCSQPPSQGTSAPIQAVVIIAVPVAVVVASVGVVVTVIIICICWRKRKSSDAFAVKATATETAPDSTYDYARVTASVNLEMDSLPTNGFYDQPDMKKPPPEKLGDPTYDDPDSKKLPPLLPKKPELLYAALQIDPAPARVPPPAPPDIVEYSQIVPQAVTKSVPKSVPTDIVHSADKLLNLDTVLAQLAEVQESWYKLGTGLGVPATTLDDIKSQCSSSQECLIETVDSWMRGHTGTPTWRIITAVLRQINFQSLAASIDQVYVTGELPTPFDNRIPSLSLGNPGSPGNFGFPDTPPPPIPARINSLEEEVPPKPPRYRGGEERETPPLPPRVEPESAVPPHPPKSHESAPPRPARRSRRRTPERDDIPPPPPKPAPYHGGQ